MALEVVVLREAASGGEEVLEEEALEAFLEILDSMGPSEGVVTFAEALAAVGVELAGEAPSDACASHASSSKPSLRSS